MFRPAVGANDCSVRLQHGHQVKLRQRAQCVEKDKLSWQPARVAFATAEASTHQVMHWPLKTRCAFNYHLSIHLSFLPLTVARIVGWQVRCKASVDERTSKHARTRCSSTSTSNSRSSEQLARAVGHSNASSASRRYEKALSGRLRACSHPDALHASVAVVAGPDWLGMDVT